MRVSKSIQADIALLFITVVWASTFAVVKQCPNQISPVLFLSVRFGIASLAIISFMPRVLTGIPRRTLLRGSILSLLMAAGYILQTVGLRETTASRCAFVTSLFVLFVPLLGFLVIRYRPRPQTLCGIALATVGLGLLTLNPRNFTIGRGDLFTLLGAIVFALQIVLLGCYVKTSDYRQLAALQITGTAVICTVTMPVLETPFAKWDLTLVLSLLMTGVLATAFATYVQSSAQRHTTANRAALVFSLEPFFASFFPIS
jgi:drug/metabolite transporter (DMT)-like permease